MMRDFLFTFIFLMGSIFTFAQEVVTGLQINAVVQKKALEVARVKSASLWADTTPINLPFFDDFSANGVFPSPLRWSDRYAFENTDFPVYPVNLGAITLDAINDSGYFYSRAVPGPAGWIADHLTSRFIRLDSIFNPTPHALSPADSVYLSFFYQPQGRGRAPQAKDSLILRFLVKPAHDSITPTDTLKIPDQWKKIWFSKGMSLDTFYLNNNRYFLQVMIPITDSQFFIKKFQFQFINYVSLASSAQPSWQCNSDQWNLDNIYLNVGRNQYDTVRPEIRFIDRPPSLLQRYESMPYPQYCNDPTNEIRDTIDMLISNRDVVPHLSSYNYYVTSTTGTFNKSYSGGNYRIEPFYTDGYVTYQPFAHPPVPFLYPISSADSAVFLMKHVVHDITPGSLLGDTIQAYQKFYNYYAYDDGTAEASYGLTPAGSQLAYRFRLNKSPDTLRAIQMFFNRTLSNQSQQWFYLCVWNDNAGQPGDTIYSDLVMPWYADSINKFVTFHLYRPLAITGTFYVGWIQTTDDNLCVGFDQYNNNQSEIFFNCIGLWENSFQSGSLMIRPVVGKPIPLGMNETTLSRFGIDIYPNPCSGSYLHLRISNPEGLKKIVPTTVTVTNMFGQTLIKTAFTELLNVSGWPGGIYLLTLTDGFGTRLCTSKFILTQ
ncbi:MAG: T9SS type A sorting domain-containing protein [Bacteroidales bacterium]|nr:T9SS type A sorting domain-containing protein [Bacteroidales bacterium]